MAPKKRRHEDDASDTGSPAPGPTKRARVTRPTPTLRSLPNTSTVFWDQGNDALRATSVVDKNSRGQPRELPINERLAMALNEVAAATGRGRFLYLPSRETWKKASSDDLMPPHRVPTAPGSRYYASSPRERYLRANAMMNLLPGDTPLHAIQLVTSSSAQLYRTPQNSLVLFEAASTYHLTTTGTLERHLGSKQTRTRGGPEPEQRLQLPALWAGEVDSKGNEDFLRHHPIGSLRSLYSHINTMRQQVAYTFTADEMRRDTLPRPAEAEGDGGHVQPLGTPLAGEKWCKATPRSRLGEVRKTAKEKDKSKKQNKSRKNDP